jgi:cytoskeletal protein CcmA (bactofilin family)
MLNCLPGVFAWRFDRRLKACRPEGRGKISEKKAKTPNRKNPRTQPVVESTVQRTSYFFFAKYPLNCAGYIDVDGDVKAAGDVKGDINAEGNITVEGYVEGDVHAEGSVNIGGKNIKK